MMRHARAAPWRIGKGDGFTTMRSAPTAIVSRPALARSRSRLSTRSASALACRHSRTRLSARVRSRATTLSCADAGTAQAASAASTSPPGLDIHEHPAAGEDGEWARPIEDRELQLAEQVKVEIRDAGEDLHQDESANAGEDDT